MSGSPTEPLPTPPDDGRTTPLAVGGEAVSPAGPCDDETGSFYPGQVRAVPGPGHPCTARHPVPSDLVNHPRYRILEHLGSGGMGTVYKARHRIMERDVALKVISLDLAGRPVMVERFRREVRAAARLSHPNIVAAFDADCAGATHFLVMEFVEGVDLDRVLQLRGRLPVARACDYARQAALGLQHAWEQGMVHRDIKPHNLMLTSRGQVKILDFGLSRFLSEIGLAGPRRSPEASPADDVLEAFPVGDATDPDGPVPGFKGTAYAYTGAGTADYIAPEEAVDAKRADIRADIYSLGCTLYRFLSGRVPFPDGDLMHKVRCHIRRNPDPLLDLWPELPPRLCQAVERMMAKDPADRYPAPGDVAQALAPFAAPPSRPILLVDDDPITRTMMAHQFENRGYAVAYAGNGREALDYLQQGNRPALIVLDLMMPVMDGWEFLRRQRQEPALAGIPVVIVSAADAEQARAIALGAADCLRKPLLPEELTAVVQEHVPAPR